MTSTSASTTTASTQISESDVTALTTTFTPPARCTQSASMFDMLSAPGYFVWANEPMPVSQSTISSCYPSEWIAAYSTASRTGTDGTVTASSIVPAMSPLVCPLDWATVMTVPGNYIACCPPNFSANNPSTTVDGYRPFYGGTCYSDVSEGQTVRVTQYNDKSASVTKNWVVTTTSVQVYAHPIDGYALQQAQETIVVTASYATSSSSSTTTTATSTASPALATASPTSTSSSSSSISGGAIAGIVIGVLAGVSLLAALLWFLLRRKRQSKLASDEQELTSEIGGGAEKVTKQVHEADMGQIHEIESPIRSELPGERRAPAELEAGGVYGFDGKR